MRRARRKLVSAIEIVRAAGPAYALRRLGANLLPRRHRRSRWHPVYRSIWTEAAAEAGAQIAELPDGTFEIRRGAARVTVDQHRVGLDHPDPVRRGDKARVQARLAGAGVSVPTALELDAADPGPALGFLAAAESAVVVKPVNTGGGAGITTGVRDPSQLERAVARAAGYSSRLLLETQADGDPYRFLVLDGELLDVVRRRPPRVTGDGRSTIRRLISAENRRRQRAGVAPVLKADLDCELTLATQGLTLRSVPPAGAAVQVKTVNNQTGPRDCETVREPIADELKAEVLTAAEVLGLRLAGVDVVTPDLSRSLKDAGGVILEVNRDPAPHHHYNVADPVRATRVAVPILERLLSG